MTHVFKKSTMVAVLVAVFAATQTGDAMAQAFTPSGPDEAQVILDLGNGEVTVDLGSGLFLFAIETLNTNGFFDNAAAAPVLMNFEQNFGSVTENDQDGIFVIVPPAGPVNLGPIIPDGSRTVEALTEAGFNFRFFSFNEGPSPGFGIGAPQVILVEAIPEPSSLSLLALSGLAAIARRRR